MHLLTQSALLRALGWSLLNSLWQMAFLWLVYVFFTNIFRRTSAGIRHGLAVLLLGVGTVWAGISFFNTFQSADDPMQSYQLDIPYFSQAHWAGSTLLAGRKLIDESIPWCSTLYLLTLIFLFVRYVKQYLYSRRLMYTGLSKTTPELRVFTAQTSRRMGIKKEIGIWLSSLVEGPVTLGALKPIILIPLATASNLTPQQVETLILHELAHIRRHDYLLHLWVAALEVLFFFNPFSKLLIRSIQKEREHRCDDLVLQFRYDPHTYVSALLALAKGIQRSPRLALAAAGSNDRLLLGRVRRILHLENTQEPLKGRSLIFLFFTLLMTGMTLFRPAFSVSRTTEHPVPYIAAAQKKGPEKPAAIETRMVAFVSINLSVKNKPGSPPVRKPARSHIHDTKDENDLSIDIDADQDLSTPEDKDESDLVGYASIVRDEKRDYSMRAHQAIAAVAVDADQPGEGCALQIPAPYVPNSSFSFQRIQDSTTLPGEQFVYVQQMATRQVELAINQMKKELQLQLQLLEHASAEKLPELQQKRQILLEQLKLQQQYLQKQQQLQRKLERVGKKRVIVVI
jgi:beta-lactamase regulating signal transducer with metallopeptidase domain